MPSSPKRKKTALGNLIGVPVVGSPQVQSTPVKATGTVRQRTVASSKATALPRAGEGGKMQTIYLRDGDLEKVWNAENELKRSRLVPGRIGLSLLVRIGLDLLDEALENDRDRVLARAVRVARAESADS
jgi:hypothetical protein